MAKDVVAHDTLFLVIYEKNGIVSEYQKMLYEASLIGIKRVMYCFVCDYETNNKGDRIDDMAQKIEMTCDLLNIESLNTYSIVYDSFVDSHIIKTNEEGYKISIGIDDSQYFNNYKEEHKNNLEDRTRLGKVLAKEMAKKWTSVKVRI